jgi:hypothetical protein
MEPPTPERYKPHQREAGHNNDNDQRYPAEFLF